MEANGTVTTIFLCRFKDKQPGGHGTMEANGTVTTTENGGGVVLSPKQAENGQDATSASPASQVANMY